jgi:hypothetical protein
MKKMKKKLFIASTFILFYINSIAQLQIAPGTSWKSSSNTYVVLNDIGFTHNAAISSLDNVFKFTGSIDNTIGGSTLPTFTSIQLAKTGTAKIILGRSVNANLVSFQSGLFELNNFYVDLGTTGSISGESETSRFIGASGGYVQIINTLNAPSSVNPGNLGAVITSLQNLGDVTIRRGHQLQNISGFTGNSIARYFDLIPSNNSNLNAVLRFYYFDAELNNIAETNLALFKSSNNINWANLGATSRDAVSNYLEKTSISDFARFTLSDVSQAPVPVTGLFLAGRWENNASHLDWKTIAEYNNSHFNIERKYSTESSFTTVGVKNSAHIDGNSQSPTFYSWIDPASANLGSIQYRLKQIDRDGHFSYSNTILLNPKLSSTFIIKVYPTVAVKDQLYIEIGNKNVAQMHVRLYDIAGRLFLEKDINYSSQWLPLPTLSAGIYHIKITAGELHYETTIVKQ